jgi:hypothetical protein
MLDHLSSRTAKQVIAIPLNVIRQLRANRRSKSWGSFPKCSAGGAGVCLRILDSENKNSFRAPTIVFENLTVQRWRTVSRQLIDFQLVPLNVQGQRYTVSSIRYARFLRASLLQSSDHQITKYFDDLMIGTTLFRSTFDDRRIKSLNGSSRYFRLLTGLMIRWLPASPWGENVLSTIHDLCSQ